MSDRREWLAPVTAALDARTTPIDVFFRDDDAGWADDRLFELLDVFDRHDTPVDLAVIPDVLDADLARELVARHAGGRVLLHQHGRSHTNHEPPDRRKCEFGPSRSVDQLHDDVLAGRDRLREWLGDAVEPVFTPPWNRCVDDLAGVLLSVGIRVLSRDRSAGTIGHTGLTEMPVTVDWFGATKGERWMRADLGQRIASALVGDDPVGIMLHHAVTDADERSAIADLLAALDHDGVRRSTIVESASQPRCRG